MISNNNRFHGHNALRYVSRNGQSVRTQILTLKYLKNPRRKTPRIGVVVSKKVLKSAVGRNRIRRRLYEQFRVALPDLQQNIDIVCFVTTASLRTMPLAELNQCITSLLSEAGVYKTVVKNDTIDDKKRE